MEINRLIELLDTDVVTVGSQVQLHAMLTGAHSDSRRIDENDLFIALPGVRSQGTDYLTKVFENGALAALIPDDADISSELDDKCIRVKHIRKNGALAATLVYGNPTQHMLTFGVTGTNGKTSTCHLLKHLLEACGHKVVMLTTVAHEFGDWREETPNTTPDAALVQYVLGNAKLQGATAAVVEVSAHGILLDRILGCQFDGVVFTNLSTDHQDCFAGIEPYFNEKQRLFMESVYHKPNCVAAICTNDAFGKRLAEQCPLPHKTFSFEPATADTHVSANQLTVTPEGIRGDITVDGQLLKVHTSLTSSFNCLNITGAATLAVMANLPIERIRQGLLAPLQVPGRLMKVPSTAPFEVIVDFAHTDSSMSNLLDGLRPECQGRLLVVFGAGGDKDPARRTTLPEVVIDKADVGVITLDNPRSEPPMNIINTMVGHWQEMEKQVANPASCHVEPDRTTAIHWALSQAQPKDIVVLAGKGHETTQIFADRVEHHDDFAIAEAWLKDHYPQ